MKGIDPLQSILFGNVEQLQPTPKLSVAWTSFETLAISVLKLVYFGKVFCNFTKKKVIEGKPWIIKIEIMIMKLQKLCFSCSQLRSETIM